MDILQNFVIFVLWYFGTFLSPWSMDILNIHGLINNEFRFEGKFCLVYLIAVLLIVIIFIGYVPY